MCWINYPAHKSSIRTKNIGLDLTLACLFWLMLTKKKKLATAITRDLCSFWKIADVFHMNSINLFVTPPLYCSQSCAQTKLHAVVLAMISVPSPYVILLPKFCVYPKCIANQEPKIYQSLLIKCI